jgi:hypothetical protein
MMSVTTSYRLLLGLTTVALALATGCSSAGQYDEEVCAGLGHQSRRWVEFDLRQQHGLDQYEAVDAVDHAIREYCPSIELR